MSSIVQRLTGTHQKNADKAFEFLKVKPTIKYVLADHKFQITLPPGSGIYSDDKLLWPSLGFAPKQIAERRDFSREGELFGFRNQTRGFLYLSSEDKKYPGETMEAATKVPRASLGLKNHDPATVKVIFALDHGLKFEATQTLQENNLAQTMKSLTDAIAIKMNLAPNAFVVTELSETGYDKVEIKTVQKDGRKFLLHLTPTEETAKALGLDGHRIVLHFGLDLGAREAFGLQASEPFVDRFTVFVKSLEEPDAAEEEEEDEVEEEEGEEEEEEEEGDPEEDTFDDAEEELVEEEEQREERPPASTVSARKRSTCWSNYFGRVSPFSIIVLGQRGSSFVEGQGFASIAGYHNRKGRVTPVQIKLPGDQSHLLVRVLSDDYTPHVFQRDLIVHLVLEITSPPLSHTH